MKRGTLIVFEGIDGAGKATQVKLLAKKLRAEGNTVAVFSFPDYSGPVGKFIRASLNDTFAKHRKLDAYHSSFPYSVDRAMAREKLEKALARGVVICDRYTTSGLAFGAANCAPKDRAAFRKYFEQLEYRDFKLPRPDIVVYLALPVSLTQKWLKGRGRKLDANERDVRLQKTVSAEYAQLAKRRKWRTIKCNEDDSPAVIAKRVEDALC